MLNICHYILDLIIVAFLWALMMEKLNIFCGLTFKNSLALRNIHWSKIYDNQPGLYI